MVKKGTLASPATARASSVLPVPGGPDQQDPFGHPSSKVLVAPGFLKIVHDFHQLRFRLIRPRYILKAGLDLFFGVDLGFVFSERHHTGAGTEPLHEDIPEAEENEGGQDPRKKVPQQGALGLPPEFDIVFGEFIREVGVHPIGGEVSLLALLVFSDLHFSGNPPLGNDDLDNLIIFEGFQEFTVGQDPRCKLGCDIILQDEYSPDRNQHVPK